MTRPQRIVLTGFPGTGKSLVASLVAERLGWQVIETDAVVERAAGRSILDIFHQEGEERFRDLESGALREACSTSRVVNPSGTVIRRTTVRPAVRRSSTAAMLAAAGNRYSPAFRNRPAALILTAI